MREVCTCKCTYLSAAYGQRQSTSLLGHRYGDLERERDREEEGGSKRGRATGEKRAQDKDIDREFRGERMSCDQV